MVKVTRDQSGQWHTSWVEHDGHGRDRRFCSEVAAIRYAAQVECRLEVDAYNRDRQRLAIAALPTTPSVPANDNSSGRKVKYE